MPPSILFVFADQLRGSDLGVAGNPDVRTPNLDRLARDGAYCPNTYVNSAVCTPSRAIMLTGTYPLRNTVIGNDLPLPPGIPTIGTILKSAGYRTGYIGKWHLDGVPRHKFTPPGPRRHGFDHWAAYNCSHSYFDSQYYRDDPEPIRIEGYEPVAQTDLACEFLAQHDGDQPFCLFLSWGPPHDPYDQVPQEYQTYDPEALTMRPNVRPVDEDSTVLAQDRDPRETVAQYYAAITALDEQMGRLLDALDESGHAEDTIVVFTSDHGDMLWSHGRMKKQQPYEESIHIPLLVRWPDHIRPGSRPEGLISTVDLTPTLLGLAGIDADVVLDGVDRSGLLLGTETAGADSVYLMDLIAADESVRQSVPEWRGIRTDRYTYATKADGWPWVLYDNVADPWQLRNLVVDPEHAEIREDLHHELAAWRRRTGDTYRSGLEAVEALGLGDFWTARQHEGRQVTAPSQLVGEEST